MKLKILSIGKVRDKNILKMRQEFTKQINHDINFESIMIKGTVILKKKVKKILNHLKSDNGFYIAMSEEGERITSKELALLLKLIRNIDECISCCARPIVSMITIPIITIAIS